ARPGRPRPVRAWRYTHTGPWRRVASPFLEGDKVTRWQGDKVKGVARILVPFAPLLRSPCHLATLSPCQIPLPPSCSITCSPHSFFTVPAQRPARSSSPSATGRVHGQQPMLG